MARKISVVIPTKHRPGRLGKLSACLSSIRKQENPPDYEIILVDENPKTGVEELAESFNVKYVPLSGAGVVAATNKAIQEASGDVILFWGDDVTAGSRNLFEHAKARANGGPLAVLGWTRWHPKIQKTVLTEFARSIGPQLDPKYLPDDKTNLPFYFFMTANLSIPKKTLFDVGLFDEDFAYPAYEDCELGYRLTRGGVRILFNENALAYHDHEVTLGMLCDRQRKIGHGMVVFNKKHPGEKTIAAKVSECRKNPFGEKSAKLFERLSPELSRISPALLRLDYMLLYNAHLAIGVREELDGVPYNPREEGY